MLGSRRSSMNMNAFGVGLHTNNTFGTMQRTTDFNQQLRKISEELSSLKQAAQEKLSTLPKGDTSMRNTGVKLAWQYEKAEIEMGGKGTSNWTKEQRQEILAEGKARGAEGHHINSVKENPSQQADPDNIRFAKDRQEHKEMHDGDFRNPTTGDTIDRDGRLKRANFKRIVKNELTGLGLAAAIGLGVGFSIGLVASLAQQGVSVETVKSSLKVGLETGMESAFIGAVNHLVIRGVGESITDTIVNMAVQRLGFTLSDNLIKVCQIGVVGVISTVVFGVYQYIKLKKAGYDTRTSLQQVGKSVGCSLAVVFVSVVAQGIWGGYAGLILSLGIGILVFAYQLGKLVFDRHQMKRIEEFSMERLLPSYV